MERDQAIEKLKAQLNRIESKLDKLLSFLPVEDERGEGVPDLQPVRLLNIVEAGEVVGMTPGAVRRNIKMIPHTEEKGKFYFKENELRAYIESDWSKSPFKSIQKKSTEYIGFDYKEWRINQAWQKHLALRDEAIEREQAKKKP